jgi:hypothetical protein
VDVVLKNGEQKGENIHFNLEINYHLFTATLSVKKQENGTR